MKPLLISREGAIMESDEENSVKAIIYRRRAATASSRSNAPQTRRAKFIVDAGGYIHQNSDSY